MAFYPAGPYDNSSDGPGTRHLECIEPGGAFLRAGIRCGFIQDRPRDLHVRSLQRHGHLLPARHRHAHRTPRRTLQNTVAPLVIFGLVAPLVSGGKATPRSARRSRNCFSPAKPRGARRSDWSYGVGTDKKARVLREYEQVLPENSVGEEVWQQACQLPRRCRRA